MLTLSFLIRSVWHFCFSSILHKFFSRVENISLFNICILPSALRVERRHRNTSSGELLKIQIYQINFLTSYFLIKFIFLRSSRFTQIFFYFFHRHRPLSLSLHPLPRAERGQTLLIIHIQFKWIFVYHLLFNLKSNIATMQELQCQWWLQCAVPVICVAVIVVEVQVVSSIHSIAFLLVVIAFFSFSLSSLPFPSLFSLLLYFTLIHLHLVFFPLSFYITSIMALSSFLATSVLSSLRCSLSFFLSFSLPMYIMKWNISSLVWNEEKHSAQSVASNVQNVIFNRFSTESLFSFFHIIEWKEEKEVTKR